MATKTLIFFLSLALVQAQANNNALTLDPEGVQRGSFQDGSGALGFDPVQASSTTSENNFINFCKGQTLTNGLQHTDGSCNGIGA